ncbi:hypothetical protein [Pseudoalteromonas citrea]|nr:hypothetical protein [Pseudoalteromonas citrea]
MKNKPMWLFLLCCAVPLLLAYTVLSLNWLPQSATNSGKFVEGEITISDWQQSPDVLWTIALNAPANCQNPCERQLNDLVNIHTALGKNQLRVNLAVFGREFKSGNAVSYPNQQNLEPGNLYLIDHRGLVVLEYPPSLDVQENRMRHKGMLKDLKKLLNYARSS